MQKVTSEISLDGRRKKANSLYFPGIKILRRNHYCTNRCEKEHRVIQKKIALSEVLKRDQ